MGDYTVVLTCGHPMFLGYPTFLKFLGMWDMPILHISFDLIFIKLNVQLIFT